MSAEPIHAYGGVEHYKPTIYPDCLLCQIAALQAMLEQAESERLAQARVIEAVFAVLKDAQRTYGIIGDDGETVTPMMTESDAIGAALGLEDWRAATSVSSGGES